MIDIQNRDCMDLLRETPDGFYDLAIVDPPYGIGEDGRKNHTRGKLAVAKDYTKNSRYDDAIPDKDYFDHLFRVSKNQIIWGGNYFIEHLSNTPCVIVWDKNNGANDFADCELAWTSFDTAVRKFKYTWNGMLQEKMDNKEERIHPNHKPSDLYQWLLKTYAKPDQKILDTHSGSASLAVAVHNMNTQHGMNLSLTATEIDKDYYEASLKRLANHQKQLKLI